MVHEMDYRLQYNGLNMEKYLKITNTSAEDFRAQYKDSAYNRVKTQLVLEAITKAEDISVTEEDLEKEYAKLAEQYKRNVEEIKKSFSTNTKVIENSILVQKTTDKLMKEAVLVESQHDHENDHDHDQQHDHAENDAGKESVIEEEE